MGARRVYEELVRAGGALALLALAGCATAQPVRSARADFAAVEANLADQAAFDRLIAGLPQVRLDDEGTLRTFYVWEGDMLMSAEEIRGIIFARRMAGAPARDAQELLLQVRSDGLAGHWLRGNRSLSWAADCASFDSAAQCATARQYFAAAARDWVNACNDCGISFPELPSAANVQPGSGPGAPTMVLRYQKDEHGYLAVAFFANDPAFKRYISITPGFFSTSFDRAGILRHEIGHVLGYRHEHNRALTGCYFEDDRWVSLTEYDPKSVMHYFCGNGGTRALTLSPSDIAGHAALYRRP
jgi:hypothetical protein